MKWKSLLILLVILVSLIPAYLLNKYLQNKIRPRASLARLFLYMFSGLILVFIYTFLLVYAIRILVPVA